MLDKMSAEDKLRLIKFLCSFAWADLRIEPSERDFVRKLVRRLALEDDEREQAEAWLTYPPIEDDLDPNEIPTEHRKLFLDAAMEMVTADGVVDEMEVQNLAIFELLMGTDADDEDEGEPAN